MIAQTRRRLLMAARSLHDRGVLPPGVEDAEVFRGARSGYLVSDDKTPWRRSMPGNWPHHCVRRRPRCDGQRHTLGTEAGLNVTKSRSGLLLS